MENFEFHIYFFIFAHQEDYMIRIRINMILIKKLLEIKSPLCLGLEPWHSKMRYQKLLISKKINFN